MIDTRVPSSLMSTIGCIVQGFSILIIPIIVTPPILFFIVVLSVVYGLILRFYVSTSRQLKRLESSTRSPVYSHFQESIQGAASIRAYGCVDYFISESQRKVDNNLATYYPSIVANRWLAVRLELVGNSIVLFSALFAVLCRDWERWTITPGLVGLSVAYALNITQTLNWAVRMTSELETNIVAVERLKEYAEIPPEGAKSHTQPPSDWPSQGAISFRHLCLRYREDLDLVLKDIDAQIHSGEKIGIIGRTGSGKSSLALALFRIVEADSGHIDIDGINISSVPLQKLRSRLTVVPQDPVLFSGTFRMNLDPFNQFTDEKLWEALRLAHLESVVSTFPDRLEHNISEGGGNLSVGQRQLVCLARALLRKSQILVLDEAAASVDAETDALIQRTIKEEFSQCTVLTIAHRLQSIADYDRLLALKDGKVNEFETPSHLLNDKNSLYYSLAKEADMV
ncbi:hypothetical protein AB6A40_004739 [Gnathostoma spinigerum]|uniref:Uncharacterized protein n=1 Tax=Gnathostoma spinigerum TaxID=75299 RepID=A0ABD6EP36_9BILA